MLFLSVFLLFSRTFSADGEINNSDLIPERLCSHGSNALQVQSCTGFTFCQSNRSISCAKVAGFFYSGFKEFFTVCTTSNSLQRYNSNIRDLSEYNDNSDGNSEYNTRSNDDQMVGNGQIKIKKPKKPTSGQPTQQPTYRPCPLRWAMSHWLMGGPGLLAGCQKAQCGAPH